MFATLKHRNFALLWSGGLISMIGNWVLLAALPFHVYAITGSALATSGLLMAYIAPGVIFGSIAGVFVDRWDRKRLMVAVNLLQAAVILGLVFVKSAESVWLVYIIAFVESSLGRFFTPAENALLPSLVGEEHLVAANSLNSMNDNLARLVGPALGGLLLGRVGLGSVVIVDAVTYLAAALLIVSMNVPRQAAAGEKTLAEGAGSSWRRFWRAWVEGLKTIGRSRILTSVLVIIGVALFGDAILSAVMVVFVQDEMGLSALEFGWIMTSRGIGGLLGGLLIAQLGRKFTTSQLITWGLVLSGAAMLIIVNFPSLWVVMPMLVVGGIPLIAFLVSSQTLLQTETEDAYRGRVFGALGTTTTLLMLAGNGIAGATADRFGSLPLMNVASLLFVAAGFLAIFLLLLPSRQARVTSAGASIN